jgi:hypothetical protein
MQTAQGTRNHSLRPKRLPGRRQNGAMPQSVRHRRIPDIRSLPAVLIREPMICSRNPEENLWGPELGWAKAREAPVAYRTPLRKASVPFLGGSAPRRKLPVRFASLQVLPPSVDTSTFLTAPPPDHAKPVIWTYPRSGGFHCGAEGARDARGHGRRNRFTHG